MNEFQKTSQAAYSYLWCRSMFKITSKTVSALASTTPTDFTRTPLPLLDYSKKKKQLTKRDSQVVISNLRIRNLIDDYNKSKLIYEDRS